ncbi:MAG: HlyD family efflux transporter periplasmic adaptor subunit [Chloroflexota bacterium]|nr:MAG: HlyD family efflux transporter periplasmic adaptor subunit [Chloroflexota bacterium]
MNKKLIIGGVVVVLVVGAVALSRTAAPSTPKQTTTTDKTPQIAMTAKGSIVPVKQSKLTFTSAGRVSAILVKVGDRVTRGQPLAELETSDLKLQVRAAEDALAVNEAQLAQSKLGARPEEIAAAEASYAGALAKYNQTAAGATTADIKAAEAALEAAKERLAQVESGAKADELATQSALEAAKVKLSQLKSSPKPEDVVAAELARDQAKNSLWAAQLYRDGVKGNAALPEYMGKGEDAKVAAAETAVLIAEANLAKVKLGPTPDELTAADTAVAQAQAQLDAKKATSTTTVASAQAAVDSAQANLDLLKAGPTEADLQSARGSMASAKAAVETKKSGSTEAELAVSLARVQQAKTAVDQARAVLVNATLQAPFDGTVVSVSIREGEMAAPGSVAILIGDLGKLQVETSDLDEASATRIQVGQAVTVTVNAFDDKLVPGKVTSIAPVATITQAGDANYMATIDLESQDASLRWGMTTKVDFGAMQ